MTNGSYDAATGRVTFTSSSLAAGVAVTNVVRFVAPTGATSATGKAASSSASTTDANAANNDGSAAAANVTTATAATGASGTAAACATPGKDGTTTLTTLPVTYYSSTANQTLAAGAITLTVGASRGAATPFAAGDLLLIIQMQGADLITTDSDSYGDGLAGPSANGSSSGNTFTAGQYEYMKVAGVNNDFSAMSGGTITLASGLVHAYQSAAATTTAGQRSFQVVRVPQYQALTLGGDVSALPWNGSTGGILALDVAGQLNFNAHVLNVSGLGFRGGAGRRLTGTNTAVSTTTYRTSAANATGGSKGEGLAGTPRYVNSSGVLFDTQTATAGIPTTLMLADGYPGGDNGRGAPGNAGGGATDGSPSNNYENSGGGGGANGGRGGRGGNTWGSNTALGGEPGAAFSAASSSRLVLGGGGGAGSNNDGTGNSAQDGFASSGAAGGGLALVRTGSVSGTGSILANGESASTAPLNDGSGGAGAGGSILLTATASTSGLSNLTLQATGGTGGSNTPGAAGTAITGLHGPGGGGGGGFILANGVPGTTTILVGNNGTSELSGSTTASAYGAEAGTVGVSNFAISNTIAGSMAGANCATPLPVTLVAFEVRAAGFDVQASWATVSELNSAYYAVERSFDGRTFTAVGQVASQGNKTTATSYRFTDAGIGQQSVKLVYYRLRQVDLYGTSTYSPVRTIALSATGLALFPNPTQHATTLIGASPHIAVRIFDVLGRTLTTFIADADGTAQLILPADIASGVYLVRTGNQSLRLLIK